MKKLVEISKEESGMLSLLGEVVTIYCCRYIYTGKLVGVNDECVELEDPSIVFDTGAFNEKDWKNVEKLPHKTWFVSKDAIESFGIMK